MSRTLISILFIAAAIGIFWLRVKPLLDEIIKLRNESAAYEQAIADSKDLQDKRDKLNESYNSISVLDSERLTKMIPSDPDIPKLMVEIENITKGAGLSLKAFDATRGAKKAPQSVNIMAGERAPVGVEQVTIIEPGVVNLSLTMSSAYEGFLVFLNEIQQSLRLIDIKDIEFSAEEINFYEFKVNADAYWINTSN
jgi:Tfp pilus assembly protein PilO